MVCTYNWTAKMEDIQCRKLVRRFATTRALIVVQGLFRCSLLLVHTPHNQILSLKLNPAYHILGRPSFPLATTDTENLGL